MHGYWTCWLSVLLLVMSLQFVYIKADTFYTEGFYEHSKVGVNLPFSTQTSRFSDGVSTTAGASTSSTHFPVYDGPTADTSDRYKYFLEYRDDCAVQGISLAGAGDEVREVARLNITTQRGYKEFPNPQKNFTVFAALKWNPSGFCIQEGEEYAIEVRGSDQYYFDGGLMVDAIGFPSYYDPTSDCIVAVGACRQSYKKRRRMVQANWFSLICGIGEFVRALVDIKAGDEDSSTWLPLDEALVEGTLIDIGKGKIFRAAYSGQLICAANDAHSNYWNNRGNITVTATRLSWPPHNISYYEALKLPACDSAAVIYKNKGVDDSVVQCNPYGGGSGWRLEDVLNTEGGYGLSKSMTSAVEAEVYADISLEMRQQ